jgi:hypothetical protein
LDPKDLLFDDALAFLHGNADIDYDASAMSQDPNLFLPEADSKIRWCLSVTTIHQQLTI